VIHRIEDYTWLSRIYGYLFGFVMPTSGMEMPQTFGFLACGGSIRPEKLHKPSNQEKP